MKTLKFISCIVLALILSLGLISCSGDDGATGPTGPTGVDGIDGTDGTDGADGTDGTDGTDGSDGIVNVFSSAWFDPTWTVPGTNPDFIQPAPEITQAVLDSGVILVYMRSNGYLFSLPVSFQGDTVPKEYNYWAYLNALRIWLWAESSVLPSITTQFRYVIIQGSVAKSGAGNPQQDIYNELKTAGVDPKNHAEVCAYYGIDLE